MEDLKGRLRMTIQMVDEENATRLNAIRNEIFKCHHLLFRISGVQPLGIDSLRRRNNLLVDEYVQISDVRSLANGQTRDDFILRFAWRQMPWKLRWNENNLLSIYSNYMGKNKKIDYNLLERYWSEELPFSRLQQHRDLLLCRLIATEWGIKATPTSFLVADNIVPEIFRSIAENFGEDKDVISALVKVWPEVLSKQFISKHLLDDKAVFLSFLEVDKRICNNNSSISPWDDLNFRELVMAFSDSIRMNQMMMHNLVKNCGLCLQYVDISLRDNRDIVLAACEENPRAFAYCLLVKEELMHDKSFVLSVLKADDGYNEKRQGIKDFYNALPESMKYDHDILQFVLASLILLVSELTIEVPKSREFWLPLNQSRVDFDDFPDECRNDYEFLVTRDYLEKQEVRGTLMNSPALASDHAFWTAIFNSSFRYDDDILDQVIIDLIQNHATREIRQDKGLMCLACRKASSAYRLLDKQMQEDRSVVSSAIEGLLNDRFHPPPFLFPPRVQDMYPELMVEPIEECGCNYDDITPSLLSNLDVMKAFVTYHCGYNCRSLSTFPASFLASMKTNEDFCLEAALFFGSASDCNHVFDSSLRSNKEFMLKAVAYNPRCIDADIGDLCKDFDIALVAFSRKFEERWRQGDDEERRFMYDVATRARDKLLNSLAYKEGFEPFLNEQKQSSRDCPLQLIDIDPDTTKAINALIADFVGVVSTDEEQQRLQNLSDAILNHPIPGSQAVTSNE